MAEKWGHVDGVRMEVPDVTRNFVTQQSNQISQSSSQEELLRAPFLVHALGLAGHLFVVPG